MYDLLAHLENAKTRVELALKHLREGHIKRAREHTVDAIKHLVVVNEALKKHFRPLHQSTDEKPRIEELNDLIER